MIDFDFLRQLTETPSVGTACGPVLNLLAARFGDGYARTDASDGFCLFRRTGAPLADITTLFVAHADEIGGCVYGPRPEGSFHARYWGNRPEVFADAELQGFDYLAQDGAATFPVRGEIVSIEGPVQSVMPGHSARAFEIVSYAEERRLVIRGDRVRPYRTVWTFRQETRIDGDTIDGKALDPRVTVYSVAEAVRSLGDPRVAALFVMAEECAMDVARKAVAYLQRHAPSLSLIVNADVPSIENIGEGRLELPAIRIFEGRNFIDPAFGIRTAELLESQNVEFHLSAARSGSQTMLFTPLAPTLSIALPSRGVHLPRVTMSVRGTERCTALLEAIGRNALDGALSF
jgi:putative aminopeptidase FrvX